MQKYWTDFDEENKTRAEVAAAQKKADDRRLENENLVEAACKAFIEPDYFERIRDEGFI